LTQHNVGPGDNVFMIGRFINLQGGEEKIEPSTRFGNISAMLQPLRNSDLSRDQIGFAVEMRSRTGFSGSPVTVYRTQFDDTFRTKAPKPYFWGLLGINWGYVLDEHGENTWLNGVVPAWKILETLEVPELKKKHALSTAVLKYAQDNPNQGPAVSAVAVAGSERSTKADNPTHAEDFRSLLNAAAKTKPQDDET
jgi:hypothetical protein